MRLNILWPVISVLGTQRLKERVFEASLTYIARLCFRHVKTTKYFTLQE